MPKRISYTDDQLVQAITTSITWPEVMRKIGRHPKTTSARVRPDAERLGVDCSHIGGKSSLELPSDRVVAIPFTGRSHSPRRLQVQALAVAMHWFMERGYPVSLPVEPVAYDLVAESDSGLQRVQVKSSQHTDAAGRHQVRVHRSEYVAAQGGAPGRYRQVAYQPGEADVFFILCGDGSSYLIPYQAVAGRHNIVITDKYAMYRLVPSA